MRSPFSVSRVPSPHHQSRKSKARRIRSSSQSVSLAPFASVAKESARCAMRIHALKLGAIIPVPSMRTHSTRTDASKRPRPPRPPPAHGEVLLPPSDLSRPRLHAAGMQENPRFESPRTPSFSSGLANRTGNAVHINQISGGLNVVLLICKKSWKEFADPNLGRSRNEIVQGPHRCRRNLPRHFGPLLGRASTS